MTKQDYIMAHLKSMLARRLACSNWPDEAEIRIGGGLIAPNNKNSNLWKALQGSTGQYYVGGHRQRGTEGFWWAVRVN